MEEVGLDECGVGCALGDLCAGAVLMTYELLDIHEIRDSKSLSRKKREKLAISIKNKIPFGLGKVTTEEINTNGLSWGRKEVFHRALDDMIEKGYTPTSILVDGTMFKPYKNIPFRLCPKADVYHRHVSAASIIAKDWRETLLDEWVSINPQIAQLYNIPSCRGYLTLKHREAIQEHGITEWHRKYKYSSTQNIKEV